MRGTVGSGERHGGARANGSDVVDRFEQGVLEFISGFSFRTGAKMAKPTTDESIDAPLTQAV